LSYIGDYFIESTSKVLNQCVQIHSGYCMHADFSHH